MFFSGVKTRAQLEAIAAALKIPIFLGGIEAALADLDYLSGQGVRVCLQGHQPIMAAIRAVHETLQALRNGTPPKALANRPSAELIKAVTRDDDYTRWMNEFLGGA